MEQQMRSTSGNSEENIGIPEHLRCKRSDGKQWRCTATSMPDKTVCEKHYIQAKKRAANSALRASLKKTRRNPFGDSDNMDSGNDEVDTPPFGSSKGGEELMGSVSSKKYISNQYSSESPPTGSLCMQNPLGFGVGAQRGGADFDDNQRSFSKTPRDFDMKSLRNKSQKNFDNGDLQESSDESTDSSDASGGLTCHQCRRNDTGRVYWCLNCDRRGYCDSCISKWYADIPLQEVQRICPLCRGTCNCKVCLRGDVLIKSKIREIAVSDKLQYSYNILSSILPVVKQIYSDQCSELELESRLRGTKVDIPRAKVHADEQMFCNCCRISIIDYHRHCTSCLYDLCITCCQDLRQESMLEVKGELAKNRVSDRNHYDESEKKQLGSYKLKWNSTFKYHDWNANSDGSIPCPPKAFGGCGCPSLTLRRLLKMNWVSKLMKSVDEMVNGCKVFDVDDPQSYCLGNSKLRQFCHREDNNDNFLYCPASQDIKLEGIRYFQKHWLRGEPVIVKQVYDCASSSSWDPMAIWRGIREIADEKMKDDIRTVKAIDCLNWTEADIELGQFIKGYTEGRIHEDGWPEMLKLKSWPSPSASEEFLLDQKPEFISKLPLLEYIHSKFGLLNVAAKLPHFSLQKDVGPRFLISYGTYEELGRGDSVTNLNISMRDMVYFLMHTHDVKVKGWQRTHIEKIQKTSMELDPNVLVSDAKGNFSDEHKSPDRSPIEKGKLDISSPRLNLNEDEIMEDQFNNGADVTSSSGRKEFDSGPSYEVCDAVMLDKAHAGAVWDVFRRQDVPKLVEYLTMNWKGFRMPSSLQNDSVKLCFLHMHPLYDKNVFLNSEHKRKLKDEFRIEPWTFEQHLGDAVFIPAGCPFQVRNLQVLGFEVSEEDIFPSCIDGNKETFMMGLFPSKLFFAVELINREFKGDSVNFKRNFDKTNSSVQLALDFLSPESLGDSVRLAEEIRCLPNDHEAKLQMLEMGKMALYAASSAIKEVEKLALDPKVRAELGFEDPNLTAMVSDNLEKMIKRTQIACV
ncbi:hypothetical protein GIB67_015159 [Kingdonia uniflora]|uniref:Lysine-specific demethylase JMJ25 n=1 Tax=Kingdonia uniflora TaxID=39325 RepID=A0A7J7LJ66_9MAGN|nr:hypothetical protein GIB67_015159 [Kingdonia uniflora]